MADRSDLDAGAVIAHGIFHAALDSLLVPVLVHVDEIDDDQSRKVAKPQLAGQLVRRFEIRLQRRFLDVALAGGAARVHVDGDKRLGLVDHQIAAGLQCDLRVVDGVHLLFDLIALEDRHRVVIFLHALQMAGNQHLHLRAGFLVGVLALDQHLVNLTGVEVADRALHQVAFLVDEAWCL